MWGWDMTVESQAEPALWKTAIALPIVLVVWTVVSSFVSVVTGLINELFSDQSELLTNFWCQVVGGGCGIYAAKWICDRWLKPYSHHVLFMFVVLCAVGILALQYYVLHEPLMTERTLDSLGNSGASIALSYYVFWRNQPLEE